MFCDEKYIDLKNGLKLYAQIREGGHKDWIIAIHGLGEHLGRHDYLPDLFSSKYNICQFDLRGHGKSQGKRGAVKDFKFFSDDLIEVIDFLQNNFEMKDYTLFGHSMGSLVCSDFVQNHCPDSLYPRKVFLSCPPVGMPGIAGRFADLLPYAFTEKLSNLKVGMNVKGLLDIKKLSHDNAVYEAFINDSLVITKPHLSLILNLIHTSRVVFSKPLRTKCPLYCAVASADALVDAKSSIYFFEHLEKSCVLKVFKDAYHEMHNEQKRWKDPYFEFLKASLA